MFPKNPIRGELYIVANKKWLFNGYGFIPIPKEYIEEELDPIWDSEKWEYVKRDELSNYTPISELENYTPKEDLINYLPKDELGNILIEYVKVEDLPDYSQGGKEPDFQLTILQKDFQWYNDFLKIDVGERINNKKIEVIDMFIYTSKGIIKGNSIISYPTSLNNGFGVITNYFYLKDSTGLITRTFDIEQVTISFNLVNSELNVDLQHSLGRNILFEETSQNRAHGEFTMEMFKGVYPENTHELVLSIDTEVNGSVNQSFQPYLNSLYKCNITVKPYVRGASTEEYLSNPEILSIGAHYSNNKVRVDITDSPTKFLDNSIAVSAGLYSNDTTVWTSYGYGVEFFESFGKEEIDIRYPHKNKLFAIAKIKTTPDNKGFINLSNEGDFTQSLTKGETVYLKYPDNELKSFKVKSIISPTIVKIDKETEPITGEGRGTYLYIYTTVGRFGYYRAQQSPTCGMVAAKFRKIQDYTNANWQLCREAARMTASNSTYEVVDGKKVWTTNWDMYRGFGIINADEAIRYIFENYINNENYISSTTINTLKSNPFVDFKDLEFNSFVNKKQLKEFSSLKIGALDANGGVNFIFEGLQEGEHLYNRNNLDGNGDNQIIEIEFLEPSDVDELNWD